jgi:hypothetical protein
VIWILLAALGIPLWMIAGMLVGTLLSRRAFKRIPGVFPAKLRTVSGEVAHLKSTWPRRLSYVIWVHDVLLVQRGVALLRTSALPVARATGSILISEEISGLGERPPTMTISLDNGAEVELASRADARDTMVGPFIAAAAPSSANDH